MTSTVELCSVAFVRNSSINTNYYTSQLNHIMITPTTLFSMCYLAFVGICVAMQRTPVEIFAAYCALSVYGYAVFARDKRAAINGGWRVSEKGLVLSCLFGGWPGALVAQVKCRHKTKKQPFKTLLWIAIAVNCAAFLWTLSPTGIRFIESIVQSFDLVSG